MCWNAQISINTFIITLFSIILAYLNKTESNKLLVYVFVFSLIQLLEYFIWTDLKKNGGNGSGVNTVLSNIGMLVLVLECYASINLINNTSIRNYSLIVFTCLVLLGMVFHGYTTANTSVGSNGHLQWNWTNSTTLYTIIYLIFFIGSAFLWKNNTFIKIMLISSLIISAIWAYLINGGLGTLWCWIANLTSLYLLYGVVTGCF